MDEQITYFHLPNGGVYEPGKPVAQPKTYGGSMPGFVPLAVGTTVTLHGVEGIFTVIRSHFHWGQPDEEPGLHIFLERRSELK